MTTESGNQQGRQNLLVIAVKQQIVIALDEFLVRRLRGWVFNVTSPCENMSSAKVERTSTLLPAQNHTNGVQGKVCDEELARRNPVKKLAYLFRSRLIEDTLKPYIGIYQKHVLIPPPFQRYFLKSESRILIAVFPKCPAPILPQCRGFSRHLFSCK